MNVRDHINEKALAVLDAADTNIADGTLRDLVAVEDAYNHWEDEGSPLLAARTKAVLEAVEKTMGLYDSIDDDETLPAKYLARKLFLDIRRAAKGE